MLSNEVTTPPPQGLGCPVGSVVVGSRELVAAAIRLRKVLGGGMRQVRVTLYRGTHSSP